MIERDKLEEENTIKLYKRNGLEKVEEKNMITANFVEILEKEETS